MKPLRILLVQGTFCAIYEGRKQVAVFKDTPKLTQAQAEYIRTMDLSEEPGPSTEQT